MTKALDVAFRAGLALFLLGGMAVVAIQAVGLVAGSAGVAISAAETIGPAVYTVAGITGVIAFIRSYVEGWKPGD